MMQFSVAPWRVLSAENAALCLAAAKLHTRFGARIVALADVYDALTSKRVYKSAIEHDKARTIIVEGRSSNLMFWQKKLKSVSDQLIVITRDGSQGVQGHIGNLQTLFGRPDMLPDRVIVNGCNYLMMRTAEETRPLNIRTIVSLNTLMIDGTGMCGVCRLTVSSSTKFACVDGPHFDAHEVDWIELAQRRKAYLSEETQLLRSSLPQEG